MIIKGDCLVQMQTLADNSIAAVVTDPPWNLRFMQKKWDYQLPSTEIWREVMRVLKPGGHALICCGTRTQDRMVVNVEDAGFEVRDICLHIFGSGFPKSHNISVAIDKLYGAEREVLGYGNQGRDMKGGNYCNQHDKEPTTFAITAPSTPDAIKWAGWGSALKPAVELWTLVRKPLSEPTIAANVLKWGTGGLNIDASRIGFVAHADDKKNFSARAGQMKNKNEWAWNAGRNPGKHNAVQEQLHKKTQTQGRFPANLILGCDCESDIHDEGCAVAMLDAQSGVSKSGEYTNDNPGFGDTGGASRFFKIIKDDDLCNANGASANLSQSKQLDDFVQSLAAIVECAEEPQLKSILNRFTREMQSELKQSAKPSITAMLNTAEKCSQELKLISTSRKDLAGSAAIPMLTDIITTIQSLSMLSSSVESVTSSTTPQNSEVGVKDFAPRFRYCAKASTGERNHGLEGMPSKHVGIYAQDEWSRNNLGNTPGNKREPVQNHHPTVKPIKLLEYLIRMITPPGGRVLDPFAGSGSTLVAAKRLGFEFIGIEIDAEYVAIAEKRVAAVCL